jgi:hypothetical protein
MKEKKMTLDKTDQVPILPARRLAYSASVRLSSVAGRLSTVVPDDDDKVRFTLPMRCALCGKVYDHKECVWDRDSYEDHVERHGQPVGHGTCCPEHAFTKE